MSQKVTATGRQKAVDFNDHINNLFPNLDSSTPSSSQTWPRRIDSSSEEEEIGQNDNGIEDQENDSDVGKIEEKKEKKKRGRKKKYVDEDFEPETKAKRLVFGIGIGSKKGFFEKFEM